MQISSATTPYLYSVPAETGSGGSAPTPAEGSDRAELNISSDTFSSFVEQAKSYPEVRSDVVNSFKSQIQNGHYPPQDIVEGLLHLVGSTVLQNVIQGTTPGETHGQSGK
ncbi:MAG: flagellar biosynthesis anti-sigma factor FlgM [Verrucomicrobiota bacterium]